MRFSVDRLDHIVMNCKDVDITASWYQRVLGMEQEAYGKDNRTALRFGGQKINLRPYDASQFEWLAAEDRSPGTQDLCFIVTVTAAEVVGHLQSCGVEIVNGPVERLGALGTIHSVYTRDPDGNLIEVSSYSG